MLPESLSHEGVEISPRFRRSLEDRIARLDQGADFDEQQLDFLRDQEHIRRQRRLVAAQRQEALRMRLFLDRAGTRLPRPLIALDDRTARPPL
jgi:hypothetical protein